MLAAVLVVGLLQVQQPFWRLFELLELLSGALLQRVLQVLQGKALTKVALSLKTPKSNFNVVFQIYKHSFHHKRT